MINFLALFQMAQFLKVGIGLRMLLKKQQEVVREKHKNADFLTIKDEIEVYTGNAIDREAEKLEVLKIEPTRGQMRHELKYGQDGSFIIMYGFGYNYRERMCEDEGYTKVIISIGYFKEETKLAHSIKFRSTEIIHSWNDLTYIDNRDMTMILNRQLN